MSEEPKYWIYGFGAGWINPQPENTREYRGKRDESLPDTHCFNGTGYDRMFKEEQTPEQLKTEIETWWERYKAEKDKDNTWLLPKLTTKFIRQETWCQGWFGHWTFDDGRTDAEYLKSFTDFVDRMDRLNYESQQETGKDAYCLMGAEDRWRWNGENDNRENPICRCKHCKEQGVIRIGH